MTADQRRQFDMLVRVRNFGITNAALWERSPAAVQALARVASVIEEVSATGMTKTAAAAQRRGDRRFVLRHELRTLLRRAARLAGNLHAEGLDVPRLYIRGSKADTAMFTIARYFVETMTPYPEFGEHGLAPARIAAVAELLQAAIREQGDGRNTFFQARCGIRNLLAAGTRAAERLDLILAEDIAHDATRQAEWKQLRRLEPRRTRGTAALEADRLRVADHQVAVHG